MKIKIENDKAEWIEKGEIVAGAINYYKVECIFNTAWDKLTKYAIVIANRKSILVPVSTENNIVIPKLPYLTRLDIGFVGYTLENGKKIKQISTTLVKWYTLPGAGTYDPEETEDIEATILECYLQEVKKLIESISVETASDYNPLKNKPKIENIELNGNKTLEDLGVHVLSNMEIEKLLNKQI